MIPQTQNPMDDKMMTIEDYKQKDREKHRKEFAQLIINDMYGYCFPSPPELPTGTDKLTLIEQREKEEQDKW